MCAFLAPACTPEVITDGLRHYYYALTTHFGRWITCGRRRRWAVDPALIYGRLHKRYRRLRLVLIRYQMCTGTRSALRTTLRCLGRCGKIQTA